MRLHRRADAADQRADHAVLPRDDLRVVERDIFRRHAVIRAVQRRLILLGAVEQALGGDAALIQARAAEGALFDQRRAQARLSRALRTKIAARPAADHDQIKLLHNRTSCRFLQSSMLRRSFEMLFYDICILFLLFYVVFLRIKLPAKRCRLTNLACTFYRWQIF